MNTEDTSPRSRWIAVPRLVGQILLLAAIVVSPWWFGGVQARAQVWLYIAVLGAVACGTCVLLAPSTRHIGVRPALVILCCAIILGAIQLVPVNRSTRALLSPEGVALTDSLVGKPSAGEQAWVRRLGVPSEPARQPISVYPASTRHDLALLLLAVSAFFAGAVLFGSSKTYIVLWTVIAANGAAIAFFGLVQRVSWNGQLYWTVPLTQGGGPFGPFVNRNNAGGYLILCLGVAISLVVWSIGQYFADAAGWFDVTTRASTRWWLGARRSVVYVLANLNARVLTVFALAGLIVSGIFGSLSRGAIVAMFTAMVITLMVVFLLRHRRGALIWLVIAVVIGVGLVSWVGMGQQVGERLATLLDTRAAGQDRLAHWEVGARAARDFTRLGSGLGTYRFIYPRYQQLPVPYWFYHAENQYLEALVEGGAIGLLLLLSVLALVVRDVWMMLRRDHEARSLALAIGGVFAIAGQAVSACFDFGLYIPSNVLLFALVCGVISGRASERRVGRSSGIAPVGRLNHLILIGLGMALFAGGIWGLVEIRTTAVVESAMNPARVEGAASSFALPVLAKHIDRLEVAAKQQPDNAELRRELGKLWIQRYRAETLKGLLEKTAFSADDPRLQRLTSLLMLHQRIHFCARAGLPTELAQIRTLPAVEDDLVPALKELLTARDGCPLLPAVQCGIAQLCGIATDPDVDQVYIQRTRELAPADPNLLFICGVLDYNAGRLEAAWAGWKACLTCSPVHLKDVLQFVGMALVDPEVVRQLLPDSPALLVDLARSQPMEPGFAEIRKTLLDRALKLLDTVKIPAAEQSYLRATIAALRDEPAAANTYYTQAIQGRPGELEWRYEYAQFLKQQGDLEAAAEQALFCALRERRDPKYEKLRDAIREQQQRAPALRGDVGTE